MCLGALSKGVRFGGFSFLRVAEFRVQGLGTDQISMLSPPALNP